MGLKEMRAATRRERGVSPAHLGRSSCPSYAATSEDAVIRTIIVFFFLVLLGLALFPFDNEDARDSFWIGAHKAITALEREREYNTNYRLQK